jgi:glutathione S-transferase
MIRIHNFPRGARGLRVAWQCEEMGLAYRMQPVAYPPSEAYCALNPLGSVPFLEDDGGVAINESIAIMLYLAERYGPTSLLPGADHPAHARVLQMLVFGETALGMGMNPMIEAKFAAPEADKRNWTVARQEARVEKAVLYADDILGDKAFIAGGEITLADISVTCVLGMWGGALGKTPPARLASYRERLTARPAYQRALASVAG